MNQEIVKEKKEKVTWLNWNKIKILEVKIVKFKTQWMSFTADYI